MSYSDDEDEFVIPGAFPIDTPSKPKPPKINIGDSVATATGSATTVKTTTTTTTATATNKQQPQKPKSNGSSSLFVPPSAPQPPKRNRKVILQPGYSALDWARLTSSGTDLRGVSSLQKVTPSELAKHKSRDDAWSAFNGKVYNITPYLHFHPGGVGELMRAAGKDGTELFMKEHPWISIEGMLNACLVGVLVPE